MNKKFILFVLVISIIIFSHYYNKHRILNYTRQCNKLTDVYKSNQDINLNLITVNSKLGSRERIQKLAYEELGMFYPTDNANVHNIKINTRKESFCLIDYIVPSAEALTK